MTATRRDKLVTIIGLVLLWIVAAPFLWRTRIPDGLRLPQLQPARYFGARELHRSTHFASVLRVEWVFGTLVALGVLCAIAVLGRRIAGAFDVGRVGTGVMVGTLATLALWVAGLPFGLFELWWARRYGLSRESYLAWVGEVVPSLTAQVVGTAIVVTLLMLLAARLRRRWWLAAAPLFVGVGASLAFAQGFSSSLGTHGIRDHQLAADVRTLATREGVAGTKVRIDRVSDKTRAINAETVGFGPSTAVVLWDTLLKAHLSRRAVEVVAAHELGHVARRHVLKGIAWSLLFTLPLFWLLTELTRRRGGLHRPEVVPFALLAGSVLALLATPFENVVSRRYEAEADWMALRATHDPAAAREVFRRFTTLDLSQASPPLWSYVLLDDHPTTMQRIALTRAWESRKR